ncbi:sigma-70 family RNA polymerase sigma factor [Paenibacillus sp. MMO-177]|uniref:sigma-70 family RNA polymerase sigma factor n=1 Tax=Paenibacillus sp. MMO-177 TaxID=3081289 RepID=UPI0030187CCB
MDTAIKNNERLVFQVINDLLFIPQSVDREDLEQIGKIALWKAMESYDESCGYKMSTVCYKAIYTDIVGYLRKSRAKKRQEVIVGEGLTDDFMEDLFGSMLIEEIRKLLTDDDFNMFLDKTIGDLTFDQLATKYGLTKMQVRYRFNKAKALLRKNITWEDNNT